MFIVIGLGNPGKEYENTVHNIGFIVLDTLLSGEVWEKNKYARADIIRAHSFVFVKPHTFMNDSGGVIPFLQKNYDCTPDYTIVIHDDIDMDFGKIKVVIGRGSGGHKGIKSITNALGTDSYIRIKIGVARLCPDGAVRKPDVLGGFTSEEQKQFSEISLRVGKIIETISLSGVDAAMTLFN